MNDLPVSFYTGMCFIAVSKELHTGQQHCLQMFAILSQLSHHQRRYSLGKCATTLRRAAERAKAETNAAQAKRGRNGLWCMANPTKRGENRISSLQK